MIPSNERPKDIPELTGLRGIAAFAVLLNHILLVLPPLRGSWINGPLQNCGTIGMSLFFTLSGVVIYHNYAKKICKNPIFEIKKFFIARTSRLFPLYFCFIVLFFIYNLFFSEIEVKEIFASFMSLPIFLTATQTWFFGFINTFYIVHLNREASISWSISTEVALYAFFILIAFVRIRKNAIIVFIALLTVIMKFLYVYDFTFRGNGTLFASYFGEFAKDYGWVWLVYHSPYGRIFEFFVGCLAAMFIANTYIPNYKYFFNIIKLLSIAILVVCIATIPATRYWHHLINPCTAMLLVFCVVICGSKFLQKKIFILAGEISYSTYLLHIVFAKIFVYNGHSNWVRGFIIATFFLCTYVTSYYVYKYFELPAKQKMSQKLTRMVFGQ